MVKTVGISRPGLYTEETFLILDNLIFNTSNTKREIAKALGLSTKESGKKTTWSSKNLDRVLEAWKKSKPERVISEQRFWSKLSASDPLVIKVLKLQGEGMSTVKIGKEVNRTTPAIRNIFRQFRPEAIQSTPIPRPKDELTSQEISKKKTRKILRKGDPSGATGEIIRPSGKHLHHGRAKIISPSLNNLTPLDVRTNSVEFQKTGVEPLRNELIASMQKVFNDKKPGWEKELEKLNFKARREANKVPKHLKGLIVFEQMDKFGNFTEKGIGGDPMKFLGKNVDIGNVKFNTLTRDNPLRKTILDFANVVKKGGGCRFLTGSQAGGAVATCTEIIKRDPVGSANKLAAMEATSGALGKVKNVATTFLGTLGKFGARAAPLAAVAALGAVAEPLVKQFRNDDYSTYLSDPEQQGSMLLAMVEQETPKVDEEILKWQMPAHGAATLAGAVPGAGEVYKARRALRPDKFIGPMEKGVGPARAALGIKGVLGKALGASFSPLAVAATLPLTVAAQRSGGTDYGDIATDPLNWMGPAFASSGAEFASKGIKNPLLLKALRLGMSPGALRMGSRFLGLPGLALTAGMWGYDKWKDRDKDDEFKVRKYEDDD